MVKVYEIIKHSRSSSKYISNLSENVHKIKKDWHQKKMKKILKNKCIGWNWKGRSWVNGQKYDWNFEKSYGWTKKKMTTMIKSKTVIDNDGKKINISACENGEYKTLYESPLKIQKDKLKSRKMVYSNEDFMYLQKPIVKHKLNKQEKEINELKRKLEEQNVVWDKVNKDIKKLSRCYPLGYWNWDKDGLIRTFDSLKSKVKKVTQRNLAQAIPIP